MKSEIIWPSTPELLEALKGSIPDFPDALGSMDLTIQQRRMPTWREERFYRDDKGCHFFNTLASVDYMGCFMHLEPGFTGRNGEQGCYDHSALKRRMATINGTRITTI